MKAVANERECYILVMNFGPCENIKIAYLFLR